MAQTAPAAPGIMPSAPVASARGRRRSIVARLIATVAVLLVALVFASLVSTSVGPYNIPLSNVAAVLLSHLGIDAGEFTRTEQLVIEQLRLPRVVIAALVGMALAVSGATMQALFRNPMADPGIIGVSSGAATGAVIAIAFGLNISVPLALPGLAFLGALGATFVVYGIAMVGGRLSMATLLLAGVAVSAFLGAVTSTVIALVPNDEHLRGIVYWLAGGLSGSSWDYVRIVTLPIVAGSVLLMVYGRDLNLLLLGDDVARSSGVSVTRTRTLLLVVSAVITGSAVAVSGTIGFVGLVTPHVLRLIVGPDHRVLLPASGLAGAVFLLLADTFARLIVRPAELQVGMVTAFVGAPFFIFLLIRNRRHAGSF